MKSIIALLFLSTLFVQCHSNSPENNVSIQAQQLPGFNVNNFANIIRRTSNPTEIESAINAPDNNVNNLDLNKDGQVDFLRVFESANQIQVFDDVDATNSVNVATLNITRNNDMADVHIAGNPTYCGPQYTYHSTVSLGEVLLLAYLFSPHHYYVPTYHYGYYPPYYRRYSISPNRTITRTYTTTRTITNNRVVPNSNARTTTNSTTNNSRKSISSPTTSQRSFSTRDVSKPIKSGGFGTSRNSGSSSGGFGGSSSGRSSFGGGRSSFGRRR